MDYTQHYNLKKPAYGEAVDVKDLNDNADITDAQLNTLAELVAARLLKTDLTNQIINDTTKAASAATVYSVNKKADDLNSDLSNQRRTITRVRVAITNGVGTYNVTQVGLSGGNCIPVIYSMSDGIFWSEVSVAIQNDLVVVGFSSGQSGWAEVNIFSFE